MLVLRIFDDLAMEFSGNELGYLTFCAVVMVVTWVILIFSIRSKLSSELKVIINKIHLLINLRKKQY